MASELTRVIKPCRCCRMLECSRRLDRLNSRLKESWIRSDFRGKRIIADFRVETIVFDGLNGLATRAHNLLMGIRSGIGAVMEIECLKVKTFRMRDS